MPITIIGLGPGDPGAMTRAAWERIQQASTIYLRTAVHPSVAALPSHISCHSFDTLYEQAESFEHIYVQIAQTLIAHAQAGEDVIYAVPGDPSTAEASTRHIRALAQQLAIPITIMPGVSFIEPICAALGIDALAHGLQLLDALDLIPPQSQEQHQQAAPSWASLHGYDYEQRLSPFPLVASRPALICQVYSRSIASHVKLSLMERYPSNHLVSLVYAAGVSGEERVLSCPLHELDHHPVDHLSTVFVPALAILDDLRSADGLSYVVERLLGPDGCPWDREQSPQSMRSALLGELYEVLEALDADDPDALSEELGDLMLNIIFQAEIARQAASFSLEDVYEQVSSKLIRRHPHVFGVLSVDGSGDVLRNWDAIKKAEHAVKGKQRQSALDGIPVALPGLMFAQEILRKAAKSRDQISGISPEIADISPQIELLKSHAASAAPHAMNTTELETHFGGILMSIVALAQSLHVDAETALRSAATRFAQEFRQAER